MDRVKCKECKVKLNYVNILKVTDMDFSRVGFYCNECGDKVQTNLKNQRFVEEYRGNKIYQKDGKYSPYWQAGYYFMSLEHVKMRIDNNTVGIYPHAFFTGS